jgi:hypothetical protein
MKPWGTIDWKHWPAKRHWLLALRVPWHESDVITDLRYWDEVRRAAADGEHLPKPPGYRRLMADWSWGERRTRSMMANEGRWKDSLHRRQEDTPVVQAAKRRVAALERKLAALEQQLDDQGGAGDAPSADARARLVDDCVAELQKVYPKLAKEVLGKKVGATWGRGDAFRQRVTRAIGKTQRFAKTTGRELDPVNVFVILAEWVFYAPAMEAQGYRGTADPIDGVLRPTKLERNIQAALDWRTNGSTRAELTPSGLSSEQKAKMAEAFALTLRALSKGRTHRITDADFVGREDAEALVSASRAIAQQSYAGDDPKFLKKTWLGVYAQHRSDA